MDKRPGRFEGSLQDMANLLTGHGYLAMSCKLPSNLPGRLSISARVISGGVSKTFHPGGNIVHAQKIQSEWYGT